MSKILLIFLYVGIQLDTLVGFYIYKTHSKAYSNNEHTRCSHKLQSSYQPSPSVWTVFGDLASKTGATNLGQVSLSPLMMNWWSSTCHLYGLF